MTERTRPPIPDQAARDEIASRLDVNMLVEAGAGTGKTTSLVGRMLETLRHDVCAVDEMATITFTRKAAAELRSRFQIKLEAEARAASGEQKQLLEKALKNIEQCNIGTIHSFCGRLIRERPVEAGVSLSFREIDDVEDAQLLSRIWEEHAASLYAEDSEVLDELNQAGLNIGQLKSAFNRLSQYPDVDEWPAEVNEPPDLGEFVKELKDYCKHIKTLLPSLPEDPGNDELIPRYRTVERMTRLSSLNNLIEVIAILAECKKAKIVQKMWPEGKEQAKEEDARWKEFIERHQPLMDRWLAWRYWLTLKAVQPALALYEERKRASGMLNFQDLLMIAASMLREKPKTRQYFQTRLKRLLIDEFQDTDPIQAEVMMLLTSPNIHESNWRRCEPAPGSLFIVGDPKQSIYRFRRADIQIYNEVKAIIERSGGVVNALSTNFRTDAPILNWVNKVFEPMFPDKATDQAPQYIALQPPDPREALSGADVHKLTGPDYAGKKEEIVIEDARRIAEIIHQSIEDGSNPGDFMIVTYKKANMGVYAAALQALDIPHQMTGGDALSANPALSHLASCLKAIIEPDNPIALVSLLRSDIFGFSDPELFAFRQAGGQFKYTEEIPATFSEAAAEFADAFQRLKRYAGWLKSRPPIAALEAIADDLGLFAWLSAAPEANHQCGGLAKCFELLRARQREWTHAGELAAMLETIATGDDAFDGIEARPPADPGVRIMNLHKVKGLEAPVVFLADPNGSPSHRVDLRIERNAGGTIGYAVFEEDSVFSFQKTTIARPLDWQRIEEAEKEFLEAEFNRLLYVAATRAKHRLYVSSRIKRKSSNPWDSLASHAHEHEDSAMSAPARSDSESQTTEKTPDYDAHQWRPLLKPSYVVQSAHDLLPTFPGKQEGQASQQNDQALEWGSFIHKLMQLHLLNPSRGIRQLAETLKPDLDLNEEIYDEGVELAEAAIKSPVMERARNAKRFYAEIPLQVLREEPVSGLPALFRGVIDLVFEDENGWTVIDYKTDRVTKAGLEQKAAYYRPQIEAYALEWSRITGKPVNESGLYFIRPDEYLIVEAG